MFTCVKAGVDRDENGISCVRPLLISFPPRLDASRPISWREKSDGWRRKRRQPSSPLGTVACLAVADVGIFVPAGLNSCSNGYLRKNPISSSPHFSEPLLVS